MRILIAEDEAVSRRILQNELEKLGYDVAEAEDGAAAWEAFESGEFPIVISDWLMPEMDGLELVRRIRGCRPPGRAFIILLTAKSEDLDLVRGVEAGADDILIKPFDRDELAARLRAAERVLTSGRSLTGGGEQPGNANERDNRDGRS